MKRSICLGLPICVSVTLPAQAEVEHMSCAFPAPCIGGGDCASGTLNLTFSIDHLQFTPPVLRRDPPKRKVTDVIAGDLHFRAEPILMDSGLRGFWGYVEGIDHLLTVKPDGVAIYTVTPPGTLYSGNCEVTR